MSRNVGVPVVVTALVGMAAGVLGSAAFSHWRDSRVEETRKPLPGAARAAGDDTAGDDSAAALRELRGLLERERAESSRREVAASIAAAVAAEPAAQEPGVVEPPELSLEEQGAEHVERHEAALAEHDGEPRDPSWAPAVEASLLVDLNAVPNLGGRATRVDCRMTSCVAEIRWPDYATALASYANVLHAELRANCSRATVLPEPSQRDQAYQATFVLDCESHRAGD